VHRLIVKQLAKATDANGTVDVAKLSALVDRAYEEFDSDRRRTDRSMSLMIEELDGINRNLEQLVAERTRELKVRETELHSQNLRFNAAVSHMSHGLVMFDGDHKLIIFNQQYADMYCLAPGEINAGMTSRELIETRVRHRSFPTDPEKYMSDLTTAVDASRPLKRLVQLADGRTISESIQPMASGGWVVTHEDITERTVSEMKIAHMARHDALTDLPNRVLLRERLDAALSHVDRGQKLAVLCLDLDQFKQVNDALGHPAGDQLLRIVAGRLRGCVRDTDTIARVGGDEFYIIQAGISDKGDAERLAQRLSEAIKAPYDLNGHTVIIGTSIGIVLALAGGMDADDLLKNADLALYDAKSNGRGVHRFFEPEMDANMKARRKLELGLRRALEHGEFVLSYQPVVNLSRNEIESCEALLRWNHPERGLVSPSEFIPLAEEIGLIVELGEWVIRRACQDAAKWPAHIGVAVNLSPTQLSSRNLVPMILNALSTSRLEPHRLELEITEEVLMQNTETTVKTLHQLRSLGIRFSLDDFGTGYSSLKYLLSFPFDKIKIDRCFVKDLGQESESAAIVKAVASLAHSLKITTTAEGVETEVQLDHVRKLGCTDVQGFLFSPPVPAQELTKMFSKAEKAAIAAA
jgi:diguanylate cyclase (GGDEF)-like protein